MLVGQWSERIDVPRLQGGTVSFAWALDGHDPLQRTTVVQPEHPDSLAVIEPDAERDASRPHSSDTRRVDRSTLRDGSWTLLREQADPSPLSFRQRVGCVAADGQSVAGRWEAADGSDAWALDVGVTLVRQPQVALGGSVAGGPRDGDGGRLTV